MYFKVSAIVLLALVVITKADYSDRELVNMIDNIDNERALYLFGGLSVEKSKSARSVPYGAESVVERAIRYMEQHELKFNIPDTDPAVEGIVL